MTKSNPANGDVEPQKKMESSGDLNEGGSLRKQCRLEGDGIWEKAGITEMGGPCEWLAHGFEQCWVEAQERVVATERSCESYRA